MVPQPGKELRAHCNALQTAALIPSFKFLSFPRLSLLIQGHIVLFYEYGHKLTH